MNASLIHKSNQRVLHEIKIGQESKSYQLIIPITDGLENPNIINVAFQTPFGFYKGQTHVLEIKFQWGNPISNYFPFQPPLMTFKTPIWHPNVSAFPGGAICLDFLKQTGMWSPTCSVEGLINMIKAMMDDPNPDSPQNGDAGVSYTESMKTKTWEAVCSTYYNKHIGSCKDLLSQFKPFESLELDIEHEGVDPDSELKVVKVEKTNKTSKSKKTAKPPKIVEQVSESDESDEPVIKSKKPVKTTKKQKNIVITESPETSETPETSENVDTDSESEKSKKFKKIGKVDKKKPKQIESSTESESKSEESEEVRSKSIKNRSSKKIKESNTKERTEYQERQEQQMKKLNATMLKLTLNKKERKDIIDPYTEEGQIKKVKLEKLIRSTNVKVAPKKITIKPLKSTESAKSVKTSKSASKK